MAINPVTTAIALTLIQTLVANTPAAINAVAEIMAAWRKQDPSGQDFQGLADLCDQLRPKDPLKKVGG